VSWYQKGKTNRDFTEAKDSEWQWHKLGHMQVCISLLTDNHATTQVFTGQMPFLPPNQQRQSTEGNQSLKETTSNRRKRVREKQGKEREEKGEKEGKKEE